MASVVSDIVGSDPIRHGDGARLTVYASLVPSLYDTITGDEGDDFIVGVAARTVVQGTGPLRSLACRSTRPWRLATPSPTYARSSPTSP